MGLTEKIQSLTTKANQKTGQQDSTLSDAVDTLIDGYDRIPEGYIKPTGTLDIGTDGEHNVKNYEKVNVHTNLQSVTVNPSEHWNMILPEQSSNAIDGFSEIYVNPIPSEYIIPTGTKNINITENGTTTEDVTNYATAQITTNVVNQDYEDALVAFGVTEDLTDSIEALTTYSNEVTGESDTTLSDAIRTLTDGYGGGGSLPSVISQIKGGSFTPGSDIQASAYPISHGLGAVPTGVLLWTEDRIEGTPTNRYVQSYYISIADLTVNVAVAATTILNINGSATALSTSNTSANVGNTWTTENFKYNDSNLYYKAGTTYRWIAYMANGEPTPGPSDLPAEYQEVAYIENTGNSYIDTGYSLTSDVTEQSVKIFSRPSAASSIFGAERSGAYTGVLWTATGSVPSALFISSTKNAISEALQLGIWHTVTIKTTSETTGSFIVDGYERSFTYSGGVLKGYPIWLFNNNNASTAQYAKNKIARFQITDNGVKVRDLVPCYRKADNKPGMYDLVNNVFYTNVGTDEFSYGEIN